MKSDRWFRAVVCLAAWGCAVETIAQGTGEDHSLQATVRVPHRVPSPPLGDGPWNIETEELDVRVEVVTKGLEHPWGMAILANGDILVTERPGRLRVLRGGVLDPEPIGGIPKVRADVLGGLLDVALHPDFETNRFVYLTYSKPDPAGADLSTTALARGRWDGGSMLRDVDDIFVADNWYGPSVAATNDRCCGQPPPVASYGSRIVFDRHGLLFMTIGDRGWGEMAQEPGSHLGKILRMRDDGSVPPDNPFAGKKGYKPEIWTLGHRNPLGLTIDAATGKLWSTEFGPSGGDELNRIEAGKNYGWLLVSEGTHYNGQPPALGHDSVPGMTDPVLFWVPSINPGNILFYHGPAFPAWSGDLLMAAHTRSLVRIRFDADGGPVHQERMLEQLGQRIRDVRWGPDGFIYLLTDESAGAMLRVRPAVH